MHRSLKSITPEELTFLYQQLQPALRKSPSVFGTTTVHAVDITKEGPHKVIQKLLGDINRLAYARVNHGELPAVETVLMMINVVSGRYELKEGSDSLLPYLVGLPTEATRPLFHKPLA